MRKRGSITFTSAEGITIPLEAYVEREEEERIERETNEVRKEEIDRRKRGVTQYVKPKGEHVGRRVFSTKQWSKLEVHMENMRRKGTITARLIDWIAERPAEKGYTLQEACEALDCKPQSISGTLTEIYQALTKIGKIIREPEGIGNRYYVEEGINSITIYTEYRNHMKEKREGIKSRKRAASASNQSPAEVYLEEWDEFMEKFEKLSERVEGLEIFSESLDALTSQVSAMDNKFHELHKHIELLTTVDALGNEIKRTEPAEGQNNGGGTTIPSRIDINVNFTFSLGRKEG